MKKFYTLIATVLVATSSFAQTSEQGNANLISTETITKSNGTQKTPTDTIGWSTNSAEFLPVFAVGGTVTNYGHNSGGYIYGNNASVNDIDVCAQGYKNLNSATFDVEGVLIAFAEKHNNDPSSEIKVLLYEMGANQANEDPNITGTFAMTHEGPNSSALGTTILLLSDANTTTTFFTYAPFSSPLTINGKNFAIAIDADHLEAKGDTVGVLSDELNEGIRYAFHNIGITGEWYVSNDIFGGNLDNNIAVFAVIDDGSVGINDTEFFNNMQLSVFPNPAIDHATISYNLDKDMNDVVLIIYDMDGKEIHRTANGNQSKGSYNVMLDVSGYEAGNYFYSLVSGGNRLTKRMVIVK